MQAKAGLGPRVLKYNRVRVTDCQDLDNKIQTEEPPTPLARIQIKLNSNQSSAYSMRENTFYSTRSGIRQSSAMGIHRPLYYHVRLHSQQLLLDGKMTFYLDMVQGQTEQSLLEALKLQSVTSHGQC